MRINSFQSTAPNFKAEVRFNEQELKTLGDNVVNAAKGIKRRLAGINSAQTITIGPHFTVINPVGADGFTPSLPPMIIQDGFVGVYAHKDFLPGEKPKTIGQFFEKLVGLPKIGDSALSPQEVTEESLWGAALKAIDNLH